MCSCITFFHPDNSEDKEMANKEVMELASQISFKVSFYNDTTVCLRQNTSRKEKFQIWTPFHDSSMAGSLSETYLAKIPSLKQLWITVNINNFPTFPKIPH